MSSELKPLIRPQTLNSFEDYFVDWTLREISREFDAAAIELNPDAPHYIGLGQRRALVNQYYSSLDLTDWNDVKRLLEVFSSVMRKLEEKAKYEPPNSDDARLLQGFIAMFKRDGFEYCEGEIHATPSPVSNPAILNFSVDAPYIKRQIDRAEQALNRDDPCLAIGTAKELLETTCKSILVRNGVQPDEGWNLLELVKETRKVIKLVPEEVRDTVPAASTIKQLLNSLGSVAHALTELRNDYGTGHGREGNAARLKLRHARLAVGAAQTLALFFFETEEDRRQ